MKKLLLPLLCAIITFPVFAQQVQYPYPIHHHNVQVQDSIYRMAYMDVPSTAANGEVILLLHGKNFNGYYWKDVIAGLVNAGYRVVVPDQIGWGRSDKPVVQYSFSMLADNTRRLLDSLGVKQVNVVGHSMGGMLAIRFAIMFPTMVKKLVLENPIGLEDYSLFVPYQPLHKLVENERKATYESIKKYQQTYYPVWKPEYEQYAKAQADAYEHGDKAQNAVVNALTYQMIYDQPVVHHFKYVKAPTLLLLGQEDRTVVGNNLLTEAQKKQYGHYPSLGKKAKAAFTNARLVELQGVSHIPHIQTLPLFMKHLLQFLKQK
ncbi:alpha/beta hydrolase [Aridibaculum aurantiacum]|uniref:alpha/beta hydrolase n=1 Tax=Aridibaculum aurantiacum TaxID=2810307 RepID=UPI001A9680C7|nr:alpha/beta hydrolase [Aridibaculum aurantiacum]